MVKIVFPVTQLGYRETNTYQKISAKYVKIKQNMRNFTILSVNSSLTASLTRHCLLFVRLPVRSVSLHLKANRLILAVNVQFCIKLAYCVPFNYATFGRTCQPKLIAKRVVCHFGTVKWTATIVIW